MKEDRHFVCAPNGHVTLAAGCKLAGRTGYKRMIRRKCYESNQASR